jgi:hypothetical protein
MEGMLAALPGLQASGVGMASEVRAGIDLGIGFLLRSQLRVPHVEGAFSRGIFHQAALQSIPGLDGRALEIRIDYTQHALSALIEYEGLRQRKEEGLPQP